MTTRNDTFVDFIGVCYEKVSSLLLRTTKSEEFLKAVAHGSVATREHVNLLEEYDLSEENFKDSVGIKPPKLTE